MNTLSRRQFLVRSGVVGAAGLAVAGGSIGLSDLLHRGTSGARAVGDRTLVLVTLYGGNDGLSTVVPYADPAYAKARPGMAYAEHDVHVLGDGLGLNPAMPGLAKLWSAGQLAVVRGVGYPQPDHSHFRSMDIWQTASPAEPVPTGWLGRWLDATGDDPVRAVNVGAVLPPLAVGQRSTAAALDVGRTKPLDAELAAAIAGLGVVQSGDAAAPALARTANRSERTVAATFGRVVAGGSPSGDDLKGQLDVVAQCIRAGVPTKAYATSISSFDTHADEKDTQERLLGELDTAVSGFLAGLAGSPHAAGVVVLAYSEFGRRVQANASDGTDHGTAGPVLLAGAPVAGGFHGAEPSLTDLDDGDLKASTDFRSVYAEVLDRVLGADPEQVLGRTPPPLGVLRT